jgi:hypothetical protein
MQMPAVAEARETMGAPKLSSVRDNADILFAYQTGEVHYYTRGSRGDKP